VPHSVLGPVGVAEAHRMPFAAEGRPAMSIGSILGLSAFWWGSAVWLYAFVLLLVPSEVADIVSSQADPSLGGVGSTAPHDQKRHQMASQEGTALGLTLLAGALVSTVLSPLFGSCSDSATTSWGKRVPFILGGVACAILAGLGLLSARSVGGYASWFTVIQGAMAMAIAAFNGLVFEVIPTHQRGLASGIMGGSVAGGNMVGALLGLGYSALGRVTTHGLVYLLLGASALTTAVFSGEIQAQLARVPCCGTMLARCGGGRGKSLKEGYLPVSQGSDGNDSTEVDLAAPDQLNGGVSFRSDDDLTWDDEELGGGDISTWTETDSHQELGASPAHPVLDDTIDDVRGMAAIGQRRAVPDSVPSAVLRRSFRASKPAGATGFFSPFGDHDFRWAFGSRLMYQMGIYTVQTYLLYYIRDAITLPPGVTAQAALSFVMLPLLCCALLSPVIAGWISDANGGAKKSLLIVAGSLMIVVTTALAFTRSWALLPWLGTVFGAGFGTFNALDFALAMDVLPGHGEAAAKDLGLWNLALAVPMCLAAPIAGVLLDHFNSGENSSLGFTVLFAVASVYLAVGVLSVLRVKRVK
jgi:MFS family permease